MAEFAEGIRFPSRSLAYGCHMSRDSLPQLQSLVFFESAARLLNFTAAAEELGTTQPAVSHRVRKMEESLGIPLFRRLHRGVVLTDEGQRMYETVRDSLEAIRLTTTQVSAARSHETLTLVTDFGFAKFWLMPRLPALKASLPGLQLRILTSQSEFDPRSDEADVAILFGHGNWSGSCSTQLFGEQVVPVCSPVLLARCGPLSGPENLFCVPLLHLEGAESGRWLDWDDWFREQGSAQRNRVPNLGFNDYSLVIQAALAGQGVALGWTPLVDDLLRDGQLVVAMDKPVRTGRGYHLITPNRKNLSGSRLRFHEWIVGECGGNPPLHA